MSGLNSQVRNDIMDCMEVLENKDKNKARELCEDIVSVYGVYIDNIEGGLDDCIMASYVGREADYLGNLRKLIKKLEVFQATGCIPTSLFKQNNAGNTVTVTNDNSSNNSSNNSNNNTNINSITNNLEMLFEQTKREIEENGSLPPEEIEEILEKIDTVKEINNSEGNKNSKWLKLREIVSWTATKGITVAASVLNLITAVVKTAQ